MSNMLTVTAQGRLTKGINITSLVGAFERWSQQDADARVDARRTIVCIDEGYGPAWVAINGMNPLRREAHDAQDMMMLSPNTVLKLVHDSDPEQTWTIEVLPSGETLTSKGDVAPTTAPKQAPAESPEYVQQALDWIHNGDIGLSARALVECLILVPHGLLRPDMASTHTPFDDGDWLRCLRVAARIPFIADNITKMAEYSDDWSDLVLPHEGVVEWVQKAQQLSEQLRATENEQTSLGPSFRIHRAAM